MQFSYFKAAWGDICHSQGWLKKLLLLALLSCIPVFGWVVVYGYLSGWVRDIAWGVRSPLPRRIFANEDGMLYRRGLYVLVIALVFSLVPVAVQFAGLLLLGGVGHIGLATGIWSGAWSWWIVGPVLSLSFAAASFALSVLAVLFSWVGSMRAVIYGRVSAGFQLRTIWAMMRHDGKGLLRILGMVLLWSVLLGLIVTLVAAVAVLVFAFAGVFAYDSFMGGAEWQFGFASMVAAFFGVMTVSLLVSAMAIFVAGIVAVFITMLSLRALGYWVQQFDVPHWRGQADPLPFMEQDS